MTYKWEVGKEYPSRDGKRKYKVIYVKKDGEPVTSYCDKFGGELICSFGSNGSYYRGSVLEGQDMLPPESVKRSEWHVVYKKSTQYHVDQNNRVIGVAWNSLTKAIDCRRCNQMDDPEIILRYDYEDEKLVAVSLEKE